MPSEAAIARYPYPGEEPDLVRGWRATLGNVSAVLADTGADLDDDVLLLAASWESETAATALADVRALAGLLPTDSARFDDAATALSGYVRALETARDEVDRLRVRYDDAVTARDLANADVPEALERNRYEREEYRRGNQLALERAADVIDADYDEVVRLLGKAEASAVGDLTAVVDHLAPVELRGQGSYGSASYDAAALVLSLATTVGGPSDPARRAAQAAAFEEMFGRPPSGPTDWSMAAVLDTTSYQDKNGDTDAVLRVGRVTPQPGKGLVRVGLYIPSEDVFNVPNYDLGDDRGPQAHFDPEQTRVTLYIDYETGTVVARQNPSVDSESEVRVDSPSVQVSETTNGAIRITYDATNPFAPPDPTNSHTVKGEFAITPPGQDSDTWRIDGEIGDYPAFEAYHDDPLGRTTVLLQDAADNEGDFGPLLELPDHHDLGDGPDSDYVKQFGDLGRPISGPYYEYTPRTGTPLGEVDDPPRVEPWPPFGEEVAGGGYV